jgi:hypothetical protein
MSVLMVSIFAGLLGLTPVASNDIWILTKVGEEIRQTGSIPENIKYNFTVAKDYPYVAHEWVPSLIFSYIYDWFGYEGWVVLKFILTLTLALLIFNLIYLITRHELLTGALSLLCIYAISVRISMRAEIFSYIFLISQLIFLERFFRSQKIQWLLFTLPISLLWANIHGSFMINLLIFPGLTFALFIEHLLYKTSPHKTLKLTALFSVATLFTSLVTPYGMRLLSHSFNLNQSDFVKDYLTEWVPTLSAIFSQPKNPLFLSYDIAYFLIAIFCIFVWVKKKGHKDIWGSAIFIVFFLLSLTAIRHVVLFNLLGFYIIARQLKNIVLPIKLQKPLYGMLLVLFPLAITFAIARPYTPMKPGFEYAYTVSKKTEQFIRENDIKGNVFNSLHFGPKLIHSFYPDIKTVIDTRLDSYTERFVRVYMTLFYNADIDGIFRAYRIDYIIIGEDSIDRFKKNLDENNLSASGWKFVYVGEDAAIIAAPNVTKIKSAL